jgi:quercetin dioxygenase-like cupin family protein
MNQEQPDGVRRALLALLPMLVIAEKARAQDAVQSQPQNYRVVLENDRVRVLEYNGRPGMGVCGDGMHSHPPHLAVLLSAGKVRMTMPDGKVEVHSDIPVGAVFWGNAEKHEVENIGGSNIRMLLIELKSAHG